MLPPPALEELEVQLLSVEKMAAGDEDPRAVSSQEFFEPLPRPELDNVAAQRSEAVLHTRRDVAICVDAVRIRVVVRDRRRGVTHRVARILLKSQNRHDPGMTCIVAHWAAFQPMSTGVAL